MSHSTPNPESNGSANGEDRQPASPPPAPPAPPKHGSDTPVVPQSTAGTQPINGDQPAITPPPARPVLPTPQSPANPMPHRHAAASSQGAAPTSQGPVSNSPVPPAPQGPVSKSPVPPAPQAPATQSQSAVAPSQGQTAQGSVPPAPQGPVSQNPTAYNPQVPAGSQPYPPSAHPHSSQPPKSNSDFGNELLTNVKNVWEFTRLIFTGRPAQAISAAQRTPHYTWLALGSLVVVISVFLATSFARSAGLATDLISSVFSSFGAGFYMHDSGLDWGLWFKLLIIGFIMLALAVAGRALTVFWTFRIGHVAVPYHEAAGIVAAAVTPLVLVLVPVTILYLIPSAVLAAILSFLMLLVGAPLTWISELMIFIGLNRTARFQRSPLIPHILMTMVWGLFIGLIVFLYSGLSIS